MGDRWQERCEGPSSPPLLSYSFVNILLPPDAKEVATRFRWWQPRHDGLDQNDWAIDNVLISGSADQRTVMLDTFSSAPVPQHERSPADAGPVGRIAFDMFMEDKTEGEQAQRPPKMHGNAGPGARVFPNIETWTFADSPAG